MILWIATTAIIIQFTVFKNLYPFASFIHGDSFSYIYAADKNLTINTYLIGYSKFLRLISVFAKPDIVLVATQYLFIQSGMLFLLFTILYFYRPGKIVEVILLIFMVLNPLSLYLANMISSDGLFLGLCLIWFALLLWIILRPSTKIIFWHAAVLFIAFVVRYNALIYPVIAVIAFGISNMPFPKKIMGIVIPLLLSGWFVGMTMYQYKKLTGYWQYSPFSGWQLANNAMYAYRYVDSASRKPVPEKYRRLDNLVREFYDVTRNLTLYPSEREQASTFYMWSPGMPLMEYRNKLFQEIKDSTITDFKKWASMAPLYKDYGIHIISKYPVYFLQYFAWPNAKKYFSPPTEFLGVYNTARDDVPESARSWFGYKTNKVKTRVDNSKISVLNFYPILSGIANVVMLFGLCYYIMLKGWRYNKNFNSIIIIAGTVWLTNAVFTIFASSVALRFQSFPILLSSMFALLLLDWMVQLMKNMELENKQKAVPKVDEQNVVTPSI